VIGRVTRLYMDAGAGGQAAVDGSSLDPANSGQASFVDIPTEEIDHFEVVPDAAASDAGAPAAEAARDANGGIPHRFDLNETVKSASGTYQLDPDLVTSVIRAESGFNVRAVSPKGAQGLMQLMPQTASNLGVKNAFDPEANVEAGTRYLRELLERYNFDLIKALAAYNAGPQRVEQYNGVPPYYETKAYVARIVRDFNKKKLAAKAAAGTPASVKTGKAKVTAAHAPVKAAATRPAEQN
jgi:soluble lytic murein transglycosylase-like protein